MFVANFRSVIITATRLAAILFVALLGACASLPTDYEKEPSTAIRDTGHTQLAKKARAPVDAHPGESGFYPLADGIEAMAARLILIEQADVAIDVQYCLPIQISKFGLQIHSQTDVRAFSTA